MKCTGICSKIIPWLVIRMNRTRAVKYEIIVEQLEKKSDVISIVSCNTCVRLAKTGGEEKMKNLAMKLMEDGYHVKDGFLITLPCWA